MTPLSPSDSRHDCPAPGCTERVPFERFACRRHWYSIPSALRSRLWREYANAFGEDRYFAARAECLRALGVPEDQIADENAGVA